MKKLLGLVLVLMILVGCQGNNTSSGTSGNLVSEGDVVKASFVGKMDGEVFSGGSATDQIIEIGSGLYIDGFEDGFIGMKIGETKAVNLTFPSNYYEELADKEVVFELTVSNIYKSVK